MTFRIVADRRHLFYSQVFGYEKKTLDEIAFEEMMKIDGVEKAKNVALKRLKKKYPNSKLQDWKEIYKAVMYES